MIRTHSEQTTKAGWKRPNGSANSPELSSNSEGRLRRHIRQQSCSESWYVTHLFIQVAVYGGDEDRRCCPLQRPPGTVPELGYAVRTVQTLPLKRI